MRQDRTAFKDTQLFDWELEPKAERLNSTFGPSDFTSASGYYHPLSSFHNLAAPAPPRRGRKRSTAPAVIAVLVTFALGGMALFGMVQWLRAEREHPPASAAGKTGTASRDAVARTHA